MRMVRTIWEEAAPGINDTVKDECGISMVEIYFLYTLSFTVWHV